MDLKISKVIYSCKTHDHLDVVTEWIHRLKFDCRDELSDFVTRKHWGRVIEEMRYYLHQPKETANETIKP